MAKFASAEKQAGSVIKSLQGRDNTLPSVGTVRNYEQCLTRAAEWAISEKIGGLQNMTAENAQKYLETRAEAGIGQKTLDMERQAVQVMMKHVTGELGQDQRLTIVKSSQTQVLSPRAYTPDQVDLIANSQREENALATKISYAAGLRAHELLTLRSQGERAADIRPSNTEKFQGRDGEKYTVQGKGGLVREVVIPKDLAAKLEDRRLDVVRNIIDRNIHYVQHYNIAGGQRWSNSFSSASNRILGWSTGGHGLRHSYAQERLHELQIGGLERDRAKETVSQELGHFQGEITEVYLR